MVNFEWNARYLHGAIGHKKRGELKLGHELAVFLVVDRIGLHQIVLGTLDHAQTRFPLVLERSQRERHQVGLFLGFTEKRTRRLHLQLINEIFLLVHSGSSVALFGLAFARAHQHVKSIHFVHEKFALLAALFLLQLGRILDDPFVAVYYVLLELIGKHALHGLALERIGYFVNGLGYGVVLEKLFFLIVNN